MRAFTIVLLLLLPGCNRRPQPSAETAPRSVPATLLVEREISGTVLGETLRRPFGLAKDQQGRVFVVDAGNNRLVQFDDSLRPVRDIGGYGTEPGQFDRPAFVTVDNNLNLLVADAGNRRIARFDSKLNFVDELLFKDDDDPMKFREPSGVALTDYGEMWVADRENNRIAVFDNISRFSRFVGDFGYSGGQLASPEKVLRDPKGDFLVCDAGNSRLVTYDQYGSHQRTIEADEFDYPMAAAIDRQSNVWALDGGTGRVIYLSPQGKVLYVVGPILPGSSTPLRDPSDLIMLSDDTLVLADTGNNRLLIVRIVSMP